MARRELKIRISELEADVSNLRQRFKAADLRWDEAIHVATQWEHKARELQDKLDVVDDVIHEIQYKGISAEQDNYTPAGFNICRGCGQTDEEDCEPDCYIWKARQKLF